MATPFADAEVSILVAIARALKDNAGSPNWAADLMAARPGLRRAISVILAALARTADADFDIELARRSVAASQTATRAAAALARVAPTPSRARTPTVIAPPRPQARLVTSVTSTVLRTTDDIYRRVIAQVLTQPVTSESDRLAACERALTQLTRAGITAFVDRAGRRWSLTSYLETATRTALLRAGTDWYVRELTAHDIDVVIVSAHPACAPQCVPFQGRLLSLSGATRGPVGVTEAGELTEITATLTEARARGFQHPNCRHWLTPWAPGVDAPTPTPVDPQLYRDTQTLRRHERAVRIAKLRAAAALTPTSSAAAHRSVRAAQARLRAHVTATGTPRQRHREQLAPR